MDGKTAGIPQNLLSILLAGNLDVLCSFFYKTYGLPVIVIDAGFRHISSAPKGVLLDDPYWDCAQTEGCISPKLLQSTVKYHYIDRMMSTGEITCVDWGDIKYPNLNGPLVINRALYGYSVVIYNDPVIEKSRAMQIAGLFNRCVLLILSSNSMSLPKSSSFLMSTFASYLLRGEINTRKRLEQWENLTGCRLEGSYLVLYCKVSRNMNHLLDEELTRMNLRHLPGEYDESTGELRIILYRISNSSYRSQLRALKTDCSIGCSSLFQDLGSSGVLLDEARTAYQIGRRVAGSENGLVYFFEDYISEAILAQAMRSIYYPESYLHPAFRMLEEYDKNGSGKYLDTLIIWADSFCDLTVAATRLGIQRNTLIYRLSRIEEICGIDLNDSTVKEDLFVSAVVGSVTKQVKQEGEPENGRR